MKKILLFSLFLLCSAPSIWAGDGEKSKSTNEIENKEINWMSIDDVQVAMRKQPKKVFMDVYTNWCGWCKVMDKKTFSHPDVIKYMNENFYAVKFNAERTDSLRFMGKMYGFNASQKTHSLAVELLKGQLSYPTSVIFEENFQNPQAIPGYLDVPTIEKILKYLGGNLYKTKPYPDYEKEFVGEWKQP